jgi:hypothetical protein
MDYTVRMEIEHNGIVVSREIKITVRYSPLATDLTAREVSSQRMESARDFH